MSKYANLLGGCLIANFNLDKTEAQGFIADMFAIISERLEQDKIVKVKGLGTFKLAEMSSRESVDVNTGERIVIESRNKISFTPENALRDRINAPFASFESVDMEDDVDFNEIDQKYEPEPEAVVTPEPVVIPKPVVTSEPVDEPVIKPTIETMSEPVKETMEPEQVIEEAVTRLGEPHISREHLREIVADLYKEQHMQNELEDSQRTIHMLYWVLGILIVAVLFCGGYICYHIGLFDTFGQKKAAGAQTVTPVTIVDTPKVKVVDTVRVVPVAKKAEEPEVEKQEPAEQKAKTEAETKPKAEAMNYDSDPRVRLGAYVILGIDKEVTLEAGQTFEGICKAYLGSGMECYVEAVNGGKTNFQKGDKIKIPKLMTKKQYKRLNSN